MNVLLYDIIRSFSTALFTFVILADLDYSKIVYIFVTLML